MRTIRVLHVVEASGGGVLSVVLDSIEVLRRAFPGRYSFAVAFSKRSETPENLEQANPHIRFIGLAMGKRFFTLSDIAVAARIAKLSSECDVMHCHSSRAGFLGRLSRIFANRKPIFYSPHCYAFLATTFPFLARALVYVVEAVLSWTPGSATIACGDSEYVFAKRMGGKAHLVRNGYDLESAATVAPDQGERFLVIGSGRSCPQKDPGMFLSIVERIRAPAIEFRWIGPLEGAEVATGWLPRPDAIKQLSMGNAFLMTSRWEGLPVAGLEAMAFGLPLVVRDVPGARDLVEHGVNGFLFREPCEAASYLMQLSSDPALASQLGEQARATLRDRFSKSNYIKLHDIYAGALAA